MNKRILLALSIVLILSLTVGVFAAAAAEDEKSELVGLTIINRTDKNVFVSLLPETGAVVYFLTVKPGESNYFTVPRKVYTHTTVACGETGTGTVEIKRATVLVFTPCNRPPSFPGEPSFEKIFIDTNPGRKSYQFQWD